MILRLFLQKLKDVMRGHTHEHLCKYNMVDKEMLDEIVDIMLETVCSSRRKIRIAGDDYPAELVKSKFMKLDYLIYNAPLEYANLILNGDPVKYLKTVTVYKPFEN